MWTTRRASSKGFSSMDVPAGEVRHPALLAGWDEAGRWLCMNSSLPIGGQTDRPVKVALPGPYLLTRTMWLECVSNRAWPNREAVADIEVRVLREELFHLFTSSACHRGPVRRTGADRSRTRRTARQELHVRHVSAKRARRKSWLSLPRY